MATHAELVTRAASWLRRSARVPSYEPGRSRRVQCGVVLTEYVTGDEIPDAIGWSFGGRMSILVECKATRSDFLVDQKKPSRSDIGARFGLGQYRYYLAVPGIIGPNELPASWGLLAVDGRRIKTVVEAKEQERNINAEMGILWSECRKIQIVEAGGSLLPTQAGIRVARCVATRKSPYGQRTKSNPDTTTVGQCIGGDSEKTNN